MQTVRAESLTPPTQKVLRGFGGAAVSMASDVSSSGSYVGGGSLNRRWVSKRNPREVDDSSKR